MLCKLVATELSRASSDYDEMQRNLEAARLQAEQARADSEKARADFEKARADRISAQNEAQRARNELVIQTERSKQREAAAVVAQGEALRVYTEKLFLSNQFSALIGDLLKLMTDNAEQEPEVILPMYGREIAARLQSLPLLEELASSSVLLNAEQVRHCRADRDENMEAIFASLGPVPPASIFKEVEILQETEAGKETEAELVEQQPELVEQQLGDVGAEQEGRQSEAEAVTEVAQEKEAETHREAGDGNIGV